jgi:hypothetical protein
MTTLVDAVREALRALKISEDQFTAYAKHHLDKGAKEKAVTNYGHAMVCGLAYEKLREHWRWAEQQ